MSDDARNEFKSREPIHISRREALVGAGAAGAAGLLPGCGGLIDREGYASVQGALNVMDFGANGDGSASDRAAIVSAIETALGISAGSLDSATSGDAGWAGNAGRSTQEVYFPPGTYLIDATITIRYQGVSLVGPPSETQGGLQGNGANILCDFDGPAFRLYTGANAEFKGARDLSFRDIWIRRDSGNTGTAIAIGGGETSGDGWTSGLALRSCRLSYHTKGIEIESGYSNPAFARMRIDGTIIDSCGSAIETNGVHLSNSLIVDSRFNSSSSTGLNAGLTSATVLNLNLEGSAAPVVIDGTNSTDFAMGPTYFESCTTGQACVDVRTASDFSIGAIQQSGQGLIPAVRFYVVGGGIADGHDVICVSAMDCRFERMLVPGAPGWAATTAYSVDDVVVNAGNTYTCTVAGTSASSGGPTGTGSGITDGTVTWAYRNTQEAMFAAAWNLARGGANLVRVPTLPWSVAAATDGSSWTEAVDFGEGAAATNACRVGTYGTPAARKFLTISDSWNNGALYLLAYAIRYDAGRGGLSSAHNLTVHGRRASDGVYEQVASLNIDRLGEFQTGEVLQVIAVCRNSSGYGYDRVRPYIYPYGTNTSHQHSDALLSKIVSGPIPGGEDVHISPFSVPNLLSRLP